MSEMTDWLGNTFNTDKFRTNNIEDWFDLSNYDDQYGLNFDGWFISLSNRISIFDNLNSYIESNIDLLCSTLFHGANLKHNPSIPQGQVCRTPSARINTMLDIYNSYNAVLRSVGYTTEQFEDQMNISTLRKNENNLWEYCESHYLSPTTVTPTTNIAINLSAPDSVILKDIDNLLKELREQSGIVVENYGENLITDRTRLYWCDSMALPYLDIRLWMKLNNLTFNEYSKHQIAGLLFPDYEYDDAYSKYKKQTIKWAGRLQDQAYISRIKQFLCDPF